MRTSATYDKAYFDKWYRHPRHRVKSALDIERQLRFTVAATEYLLERPVKRVLDVGAGEGNWRAPLRKLRPGVSYTGVDSSEYAVRRFGARRNIRLGSIGGLGGLGLEGGYDLVLCCGVLMYVAADELRTGLRAIRDLADGACYFEVFTSADSASGDFSRNAARSPAWWRTLFADAGFVACGLHVYLPKELKERAAALERG